MFGYSRMCLASTATCCLLNCVVPNGVCLPSTESKRQDMHKTSSVTCVYHREYSTRCLCLPQGSLVYHREAVSTVNVCVSQRVFIHHRQCLSTAAHACLPQGMSVYHRECLSTTVNVCLPQGMFVYYRACLSTTGHVCLPQGMFVYHRACMCVCDVAVHGDQPAALSSCQKKTSVDRDSRKCLL